MIAQALKYFKAGELVYAGMFGDPELYLPEGRGAWPAACRGKNLSPYRVFVPNCHADNGSLGTRILTKLIVFGASMGFGVIMVICLWLFEELV